MAKYHYKRDVFKGLTPFPFLGEVKTRVREIGSASTEAPKSIYNPNILAKRLHPDVQHAVISKVVDFGDAKSFTLVPDTEKGTEELAYFRAGQYVSVTLAFGGAVMTRPYTISSAPKAALGRENTSYTLTIKKTADGWASDWILKNWSVGSKVSLSAPLGDFYYEGLRDAGEVVAVAGGSGITTFVSMAAAIADGTEDFRLTILYGSRRADGILLKDELEDIAARSGGKVKVVHVLSDEEKEGFEHGFITAELIRKYAPEADYSLFACGPKAMYAFLEGECARLGLKERRVRIEIGGDYRNAVNNADYPQDRKEGEFQLTVDIRGESLTIPCRAGETLLRTMEAAGIKAPSHCRSGECGWCHSRLVSGEVYVPADADGRRIADKKFGWIHPCVSYPLGDVEIAVYPTYE